jgi:hypothetical protein
MIRPFRKERRLSKEDSTVKLRIASLFLLALCLAMAAIPAMAGNLYDNGPVNGEVDAWTINFGFSVSDSFHLTSQSTIQEMEFWVELIPGDVVTDVEVQIGAGPFGNELFDELVNVTQSNCFTNQFGYPICMESGNFSGPALGAGNYWVTLSNASVPSGDPVYWDENSGVGCQSPGCPSQAQENTVGTIPSESFTLGGSSGSTSTGTTPEPGSIVLFGSGVLGLAGVLRRKLF